MNRDQLAALRDNVNVGAMLRVIRQGESSQDDNAYRMEYGGALFAAPPWVHPYAGQSAPPGKASGAYQYIPHTWDYIAKKYGLEDFSPTNQDLGAIALIAEHGALDDVLAGRVDAAVRRLTKVWTSLAIPSRQAEAASIFAAYGGASVPAADANPPPANPSPVASTQEVKPMGPFLIPFLEAAASLIPAIAKLGFGSGSEVAQRNVAAGAMVADAVMGAVKAGSHEEALQAIQTDANSLQAAKDAANTVMAELGEAGGGGIDGARKYAQATDGDWKKVVFSGPFVLAILVLPLIYAVVLAALLKFEWLAEITSEVRTGVITSVTGLILGSLMGYFYGTSASSARKDNLINK